MKCHVQGNDQFLPSDVTRLLKHPYQTGVVICVVVFFGSAISMSYYTPTTRNFNELTDACRVMSHSKSKSCISFVVSVLAVPYLYPTTLLNCFPSGIIDI